MTALLLAAVGGYEMYEWYRSRSGDSGSAEGAAPDYGADADHGAATDHWGG